MWEGKGSPLSLILLVATFHLSVLLLYKEHWTNFVDLQTCANCTFADRLSCCIKHKTISRKLYSFRILAVPELPTFCYFPTSVFMLYISKWIWIEVQDFFRGREIPPTHLRHISVNRLLYLHTPWLAEKEDITVVEHFNIHSALFSASK